MCEICRVKSFDNATEESKQNWIIAMRGLCELGQSLATFVAISSLNSRADHYL